MTRTRNACLNFVSSTLLSALTMLVGLVTTPWILASLGSERFGAFRAASDWCGYLALLELGLGGALLPLLAQARSQGPAAVRETLVVGVRAYVRISIAALAGGAVLAASIAWLVPVPPEMAIDLQEGCGLGVVALLLLALAPFSALAVAEQRAYLVHMMLLVQSLLTTGLALFLAYADWGIRGQFLAVLLAGFPAPLLFAWRACREHPGLSAAILRSSSSINLKSRLWSLNWPTLVLNVCGRVSLMADNIIIAYLLGAGYVVPFFMTQRLAAIAQTQVQGLGNASWAALADLHARGQRAVFNERLLQLTRLVIAFAIACAVPIAAYNRAFISLWLGADQYAGDGVTLLAGLNSVLLPVLSLWCWAFCGTGQVRRLVPLAIVTAIVNLTVSFWATCQFRLAGPLLGTTISFLAVSLWWYPLLLRSSFDIRLRQLAQTAFVPLGLAMPFAGITWSGAHRWPATSWIGLASAMACAALGYLAIYAAVSWRSTEFQLLRRQITGIRDSRAPQLSDPESSTMHQFVQPD